MRRSMLLLSISTVLLMACHRPVRDFSESVTPCATAYQPPRAGTIRIDGPGSFGPHAGDSLIVRVDNRERWRGVLPACEDGTPGLHVDTRAWQSVDDTLEATDFREVQREGRPTMWLLQLVARHKSAA